VREGGGNGSVAPAELPVSPPLILTVTYFSMYKKEETETLKVSKRAKKKIKRLANSRKPRISMIEMVDLLVGVK